MAFLAPVGAWLASSAGAATIGVAGLGLGAYGAIKGAEATRKQAAAEQVAAGFEADQLELRAKDTIASGSFSADRISKRAAQIMASQRAAAAAGGGDTTDGTVQAITDETIRNASMDSLLTMANAESAARADRLQAKKTRETGMRMSDVYRGRSQGQLIGAAGTILGQASQIDWGSLYGT